MLGLGGDSGTGPTHMIPCQTVGWPLAAGVCAPAGGGKSGLHGGTVPGNARRGRPQGKCHRKHTAGAREGAGKGEMVR